MKKSSFFALAQSALLENCPDSKTSQVFALYYAMVREEVDFAQVPATNACVAGRPAKPDLVPPKDCSSRDFKTALGRATLIHALAHIEFNAINLALDAMRFQGMPNEYYQDWCLVAKEEAYHFLLLRTHLRALGHDYGEFPAHGGLWEMAEKTAHDCLARMACVPRLLEARGLDVAPMMAKKLSVNDANAATLLEIIMRDEEKHVRIGNRWFYYLCEQQDKDPLTTFQQMVAQFAPNVIRKPLAKEARLRAGFQADEMDWLEQIVEL